MPIITVPEIVWLTPLRLVDHPPWTTQPDGSELVVEDAIEPWSEGVETLSVAQREMVVFDQSAPRIEARKLRPYQEECVEAVFRAWAQGKKAPLIVMATGAGKSIVAAEIIRRLRAEHPGFGFRTWFLAHREELLTQAYKHVKLVAPEATCGIVQGSHDDVGKFVTIASVKTLANQKRFDRASSGANPQLSSLVARPPGVVILDEAHHFSAAQFRRVVEQIRAANPDCLFLGMSVGPDSYVELRGGPFSTGFVGRIEDAWALVSKSARSRSDHGFDIVDLPGVQARGWTGSGFAWKTCRRLLRHAVGDKPCSSIDVGGRIRTVLTDDHAVYVAIDRRRVQAGKPRVPVISTAEASDLHGAVLVGDDGAEWEQGALSGPWDMLAFASLHMGDCHVRVDCDVKSVHRALLRAIGLSPKFIYAHREAGSLPLAAHIALGDGAPPALSLHTMGSTFSSPTTVAPQAIAFVLGVWLGDGWIDWERERRDGRGRIAFAVANHQVDTFCAELKKLPMVHGVSFSRRNKGSMEVRVSNIFLAMLCRVYFGRVTSGTKRIPSEWLISWPEAARRELLRGMLFSDGSLQDGGRGRLRRQYRTTSPGLAHDVLSLLRSLRVAGSLSSQPAGRGGLVDGRRIVGRHTSYLVHWSLSAESGDNAKHRGARTRFDHSNARFHERPVRQVVPAVERPLYVYDMEMDGHPSFVANGVLVHNTATPGRTDGTALDAVFDCVAYEKNAFQLIEEGYLVPPVGFRVELNINLDVIPTDSGEFKTAPLSAVMNQPDVRQAVVEGYQRYGDGRKMLCFCVNVAHAKDQAESFRQNGVQSRHVDGTMSSGDRKATLQAFAEGKIRILTSCDVLTEGYDDPSAQGVIFARPTNSQLVYSQCLGRSLRLHPSKRDALVIDCVGNSQKHKIVQLASLAGLQEIRGMKGKSRPAAEAPELADADVGGIDAHRIDFRVLRQRQSKWSWRETRFGWTVQIPRIGYFLLSWASADRRVVDVKFHDMRDGKRDAPPIVLSSSMDFEMAYGLVEQEIERLFTARTSKARAKDKESAETGAARDILDEGVSGELFSPEELMRSDADWRNKPTSERQRAALIDIGVKEASVPGTAGEASDLFSVMTIERNAKKREPATLKQRQFVVRAKLATHAEAEAMTKKQAAGLIIKFLAEKKAAKDADERFAAEDEAELEDPDE